MTAPPFLGQRPKEYGPVISAPPSSLFVYWQTVKFCTDPQTETLLTAEVLSEGTFKTYAHTNRRVSVTQSKLRESFTTYPGSSYYAGAQIGCCPDCIGFVCCLSSRIVVSRDSNSTRHS